MAAFTGPWQPKWCTTRWAPGVLDDYLAAGIEPDAAGGVRLAFRREIETRLYNTLPDHFDRVLHRHPPRCPVRFIGGTRSPEPVQMTKLSAVVTTFNNADTLDACLASVAFADERLVLDSFSTDDTVALAQQAGAEVIQHEFKDYAHQRNAAAGPG